jgi:hypothetical protein
MLNIPLGETSQFICEATGGSATRYGLPQADGVKNTTNITMVKNVWKYFIALTSLVSQRRHIYPWKMFGKVDPPGSMYSPGLSKVTDTSMELTLLSINVPSKKPDTRIE